MAYDVRWSSCSFERTGSEANALAVAVAVWRAVREPLADGARLERLVAPPVDARERDVAQQRGAQPEPQRAPAMNLPNTYIRARIHSYEHNFDNISSPSLVIQPSRQHTGRHITVI